MNRRGAFTILELLVVTSIISLLAAIVFTGVQGARDRANITKARLEIRDIMIAAEIVFQTYGYFPNDSHGSLICPKDIVIDEATGKKWGDYTSHCNDPWGNPYEWNNFCDDGDADPGNDLRRAPHAPYTVGCESFSDKSPGRIGLIASGKGGVSENCTNDDICFGRNGFSEYGWTDGAYVAATPPPECAPDCTGKSCGESDGCSGSCGSPSDPGCTPVCTPDCTGKSCGESDGCSGSCGSSNDPGCNPVCTTTIASCSGISTGLCTTRDGCSLTSSTCSGSISNSCAGFAQGSCTPSGCSWSDTSSCGGTVTCSSYSSNQTSCTGNGCTYTASSCIGSAACSQWNATNATTCTSGHTGCSWNAGQSKCTGTLACTTLSVAACTPTGCSVSASNCSGAPSCSSFSQSQCTGATGCSWTVNGSCVGSYSTNCSQYDSDQTSCQANGSCTWTGTSCAGTASSCSSYGDSVSCSAQTGCNWQ